MPSKDNPGTKPKKQDAPIEEQQDADPVGETGEDSK